MAKIVVDGKSVTLQLSTWEKIGSLHGSITTDISNISSVEFIEKLWTTKVLRGMRAPGTGIPYVVLLGTMRYVRGKDFTAIKGRTSGVIVHLKFGPFKRWIFTLQQPVSEVEAIAP